MHKSFQLDFDVQIRLIELHDTIATAIPGVRKHALFRAAREFGIYVCNNKIPSWAAEEMLNHAAGCCGLLFTDGQEKIDAIIRAALAHAEYKTPWDIE